MPSCARRRTRSHVLRRRQRAAGDVSTAATSRPRGRDVRAAVTSSRWAAARKSRRCRPAGPCGPARRRVRWRPCAGPVPPAAVAVSHDARLALVPRSRARVPWADRVPPAAPRGASSWGAAPSSQGDRAQGARTEPCSSVVLGAMGPPDARRRDSGSLAGKPQPGSESAPGRGARAGRRDRRCH